MSSDDSSGVVDDAWTTTVYRRSNRGLEFDRVVTFSDGVFAIAMTLIAATIAVPVVAEVSTESELLDRLYETLPNVIMFFVAFFIIGRYWLAHHRFISSLKAMDSGFIGLTLAYLAFVAFLPFPSALMGRFSDNAVAVSLFAVSMAAVSAMEALLLWQAHRHGLMVHRLDEATFRWALTASLTPVVVFLASVPVTFVNTWLGVAFWALSVPLQLVLDRRRPEAFRPDTTAGESAGA